MYETMAVWETPDALPHRTAAVLEFVSIWQAAEKIVTRRRCNGLRPACSIRFVSDEFPVFHWRVRLNNKHLCFFRQSLNL